MYDDFTAKYSCGRDDATYVYSLTNNYKLNIHKTPTEETEYYQYGKSLLGICP